jgi:hypothetical protein
MRANLWSAAVVSILAFCCIGAPVRAADGDGDGVPDGVDVCCQTLAGVTVDAQGRPLGDLDGDCDVDLADYQTFQGNFRGPTSCTPEVCDGVDNNCDCIVDNLPPLTCGVGACQVAVPACLGGVPQSCTPGNPQPEICNGIDDNCDSIIDNVSGLNTDPDNCGSCGFMCPDEPNAPAACVSGLCDLVCNAGYADCDNNDATGCEVSILTDPSNCSGCNLVCPPRANASSTCSGGNCTLNCNVGYSNCDNNPVTGCEVHTTNDVQNCGACGLVCPNRANATSVCANSQCTFVCNSGYQNCDGNATNGCEIHLTNDNQNCGNCGHVCSGGQSCVNSACVP